MENSEDIMEFTDCTGKNRRFKFEVIEVGHLIRMEAKEIRSDKKPGYYFREIGMADHLVLLRGNLNKKIMDGLSMRHILLRKRGPGKWDMLSDKLVGYISYDEQDGMCLIIDGMKVTCEEFFDFVHMHEGFSFRIEFEG